MDMIKRVDADDVTVISVTYNSAHCLPTLEFFEGMLQAAENFPDAAIIAPHLIRRDGAPEVSYRWPATHWVSNVSS